MVERDITGLDVESLLSFVNILAYLVLFSGRVDHVMSKWGRRGCENHITIKSV